VFERASSSFSPEHERVRSRTLIIVLASSCWLPALAWSNPTQPNELQNPLQPPSDCEGCHRFDNPVEFADEPDYAPFNSWRGSLMANAARDPVFWAGVAIASQDHPEETSECVRCHSPRAFLEGRGHAIAIEQLTPADLESVECELCHRMMDDGVTLPGNARYVVDDVKVGGNVPRRGPWAYVNKDPQHSWLNDPFTGSSQLCGTCHDVTTPRERVDELGQGLGVLFNEQRTYSEWRNSSFAPGGETPASCQDCHMPALADRAACQQFTSQGTTHPTGFRRHDLAGANRFVLQLLAQSWGDAGLGVIEDQFFAAAMARTDELLATAATLEVDAPPDVNLGDGLAVTVTVTNETGHKLPTGYSEGRVMWIEIIARYGGEIVFESGTWQPGVGPLDDPQLRTYQGVAESWASQQQLHLLLNDHWIEDTRIPPRGLTQDLETDPVGDRYVLQMDGTWPYFDVVDYVWPGLAVEDLTPNNPDDDQLELDVRLLYLINTPAYIEFLRDENQTNSAGQELWQAFEDAGGAPPLVLAEQLLSIDISGFEGGGDGDGDPGDGDGDPGDGDGDPGDGDGDPGDGDPGDGDPGDGDPGDGDPGDGDGDTHGETGDGDSTDGEGETEDTGTAAPIDEGCSCTSDPIRKTGLPLLLVLLPAWRRRNRAQPSGIAIG
jgi:hypothetical protein